MVYLFLFLRHLAILSEFTKILLLSKTYLRPSGDLTCLIGDPSDTEMPHWRLRCLIGDWDASLETEIPHRRPKCLIGDSLDMLDEACRSPMGLRSGILVSNQLCWSSIRHVGLQLGFLVSDGSPIRHVGLQ